MKAKFRLRIVNLIVSFVFLIGMITSGAISVYAQTGSITASATPTDSTPEIGDQITVTVNIDMTSAPSYSLGNYTGTLEWNTSVLTYISNSGAPPSGFTGIVNTEDVGTGIITFNGANVSGANDNIIVVEVTFDVDGTGYTLLDLEFSVMGTTVPQGSLNLIPILTTNDGSVMVEGGGIGAVTLDAVSSVTDDGVNPLTFSHTVGTGSNRLLLVGVSWAISGEDPQDILSVTYGGSPMTEVDYMEGGQNRRVAIYSLVAPVSGTANVVITFTDLVNPVAGAVSFTGVDQSTPLGTANTANGGQDGTTEATVNVDTEAGDLAFAVVAAGSTPTVGAGQSPLWSLATSTGNIVRGAGSTELASGTTTTMSWTLASQATWGLVAVPIKPAPASGDTHNLTMAVNPSNGGTTTPSVGVHTYNVGEVVDISATALPGFEFVNWTGDVASATSESTTVTMDGNKTVTANFAAEEYTLTINVGGSGSVSKAPDQATYDYGTTVTLTATPSDETWSFAGWGGDLGGDNNPETILMDGNKSVTALFSQGGGPVLPSNFYGEVQFEAEDNGPGAGDVIDVFLDDQIIPITSATISSFETSLVYTVNVPAYPDSSIPGTVTFKFDGRVIAIADWVSGTNTELDIHPPKADAAGPYVALLDEGSITLAGTASDMGADIASYAWDLDNDSSYDDASVAGPGFSFTAIGAYPVKLKVLDAQGGEGFDESEVLVVSLDGLTGNVYDGTEQPITVNGLTAGYSAEIDYNGSSTPPINAGTYPIVVEIKQGETTLREIHESLLIVPRLITVTADPKSKEYGEVDPPLTYQVTSGSFVGSDSFSGALSREGDDEPGIYAILVGTLSAGSNYDMTFIGANFTIFGNSHDIDLVAGWNLVSFNVSPVSTAIEDVLESIDGKYNLVYAWDASATGNAWMKYDPSAGFGNSLTDLDETMGFWVNMTEAATLSVSGIAEAGTTIEFYTDAGGWNLVGWPAILSDELPDALTAIEDDYTLVIAYHTNDVSDFWKVFDPDAPTYANDLTEMAPGWGYWIFVTNDTELVFD